MEKEQTTIRLPSELLQQFRKQADEIGVSFNEVVLIVINDFLNSLNRRQ